MRRWSSRTVFATPIVCLGLAASPSAHATLIGQSVQVSLGDGIGLQLDDEVVVGALPELTPGDGSEIGTLLLPTESIDIGATSILLTVEEGEPGGGTGYPPNTAYLFSNLSFLGELTAITGVNLTTSNVSGLAEGDLTFTSTTLRIPIDALTIGEISGVDTGTIAIELTFEVIPEPGTALLVSLGLALLGHARRRAER